MAYTYVTPNADVWLYKGVPFDADYKHTMFISTSINPVTSQLATLLPYRTNILSNQMYKRVNRNTLRVGIPYDSIYGCNYMCFNNKVRINNVQYDGKWYFAFIKELNYVNEGTTEIIYEIDVMQTYLYDYDLEQCYVEREHANSDVIGNNTVPEPLNVGEYIVEKTDVINQINGEYAIVILASWEARYNHEEDEWEIFDSEPGFYGNQFSGIGLTAGVRMISANPPQWTVDNTLIYDIYNALTDQQKQEIVAIYMVPVEFAYNPHSTTPTGTPSKVDVPIAKCLDWSYRKPLNLKNNKLYTYPFNLLSISSSDGKAKEYKYELFNGASCRFVAEGTIGAPPQIIMSPVNYATTPVFDSLDNPVDIINYSQGLLISDFPQCAWISDSFKAWLAQNGQRMLVEGIGGAITAFAAGTLMSGNPAVGATSAGISVVRSIVSDLGQISSAQHIPDQIKGGQQSSIALSNGEFGYRYYCMRIKDEYAKIIDDFFTKFGYACKQVKVPNRDARRWWTYVKTLDCEIQCKVSTDPLGNTYINGIPGSAIEQITNIYNNGITFWKPNYELSYPLGEVGNYGIDNPPNH